MLVKGWPLCVVAKEEWPRGCQSWVSTTWRNCPIRRLTVGTISSPFGTARLPPGQKSFCTSMTTSTSSSVGVIFMAIARSQNCDPEDYKFRPSPPQSRGLEPLRVPAHMLRHEGGDEIVGMVVTLLQPQGQRHVALAAGRGEQLRLQLRRQELIAIALVDQDVARPAECRHQCRGIIVRPGRLIGAEIATECLLPPRHLAGRHDGREGRDGLVLVGILQRDAERAVP